jgi:serine/threonine-protein kinase
MICPACQAENDDAREVCPSCGQSLGTHALGRGAVVASRYEILASLGKGGMGVVFKARDRALDETVALKILRSDVARAPDLERRFRSEIKLARRVRHRNVCGIHEYGEDGPLRYIAMELVEGTDLKARLRDKGALPEPEAYAVAIQLTQGLEAIHDAGVVHRDLKSSNVMLDRHGRVKLMDFGIAKQLGGEATLGGTAIGHILGTPEYMSPEQARGEKIDARSDLYALGIVIYETFTGHVPFRGDTPIATIFKTLEQPPILEGPAAAGIPPPLVPVLAKALAKERAERFASARELREAIEAARRGEKSDTPAPVAPATVQIATFATEVSRPAVTPAQAPTTPEAAPADLPSDDTAAAATILAAPPPPSWRRAPAAGAARPSASGARARTADRSVWPWFLASGFALVLVAGAIAFGIYRWLASAVPGVSREAVEAPVSAPPRAAVPVAVPRASALPPVQGPPSVPPSVAPPLEQPWPVESPQPRARATPPQTRAAAPIRSSTPPPTVPSPRTPAAETPGLLQLRVTPWAAVSVDDSYVGTTPLQPLSLSPGSHTVRLTHPDYKPLQRKLAIRPGETTRLEIDLAWEAVHR